MAQEPLPFFQDPPIEAEMMIQDLIDKRKKCRLCMECGSAALINGAEYAFDPNVVSYWSQWLGHPQPRLLLVAQDFSDVDYFQRYHGASNRDSATNQTLSRLLSVAGLAPKPGPEPDNETRVFLTNSILCLKQPPMNRAISAKWVRNCATQQLRPLIEQLKPEIIVGMGSHGWRAVRSAFDLKDVPKKLSEAAGQSWKVSDFSVFAVGHCAPQGIANRSLAVQEEDWSRIGLLLENVIAP